MSCCSFPFPAHSIYIKSVRLLTYLHEGCLYKTNNPNRIKFCHSTASRVRFFCLYCNKIYLCILYKFIIIFATILPLIFNIYHIFSKFWGCLCQILTKKSAKKCYDFENEWDILPLKVADTHCFLLHSNL